MDKEIDKIKVPMGKRIRESRESMHLSRETLAERVSISTGFLIEIEGGSKNMSLDTFYKLTREMNVSADYILYGNRDEMDSDGKRSVIFERINRHLAVCDTDALENLEEAIRALTYIATRHDKED